MIVEARRLSTGSYHREKLDQVGSINERLPITFDLKTFEEESDITFRVKVVDASRRLLADGDRIRPGAPNNNENEPLIYLVPADIGQELWKVDWSDPSGPRVLVNKELPNCSNLLTRDRFVQGLVLPHIVRAIVGQIPITDHKSEDWAENWLAFTKRLGFDDPPDPKDENEDADAVGNWVDDVVAAYANEFKFSNSR